MKEKIARLRILTRRAGRPEDAAALCFGATAAFEKTTGPSRQMMRGRPEQIVADLGQYQALGVKDFLLSFQADSLTGHLEAMPLVSRG